MKKISNKSANKTFFLYSDGNYFPRAKKSGYGGYIEDNEGIILIEYSEQIKELKYAYNFEILGIIRGLQLAQTMGIKNITSYCDDKTTIYRLQEIMSLKGETKHLAPNAKPELFDKVVELSKSFSNIQFQYIPREQNRHSDTLSRRYSVLMEKNYIKQFENDILKSELIFENNDNNNQRIFFSHPSLIKMKDKNNPFLIANHRNKLSRKITRKEQEDNYQYLFIEVDNQDMENIKVRGFHYLNNERKIIFDDVFLNDKSFIENYCDILEIQLEKLKQNKQPIWIHSNSSYINSFFEQKEKLPKNTFKFFKKAFLAFNGFEKIMYHNLPFKHEFSPELNHREKKKEKLANTIESLDELIEQLQQGSLERDKNKCFGKIIRHQIRNYQELLKRQLNDIEKNDIIQKTTKVLEQKGLTTLPKVKI